MVQGGNENLRNTGMAEAPEYLLRWFERQEETVNRLEDQIGRLAGTVAALTANVQSLTHNQEVLASQHNRPFQWSAFVAALGLVAVGAGLLIGPIDKEMDRQHAFDVQVMKHMEEVAYRRGLDDANVEWLQRMEDRLNERLHYDIPRGKQE